MKQSGVSRVSRTSERMASVRRRRRGRRVNDSLAVVVVAMSESYRAGQTPFDTPSHRVRRERCAAIASTSAAIVDTVG